jgi:hypothetical protein
MNLRILSSGALSALAGAAMLAVSASPSPGFTLSSPSLERPFAADIQQVWWDRWGRWHPNYYYHPYYYHPYYRPYYYHPYVYPLYRHCWYAYGVRRCY